MVPAKSRQRAVFIFLFALFIFAGIWIGAQLVKYNQESKRFTTRQGAAVIDCVDYLYRISDILYDGYSLSLKAANEDFSGDDIKAFVIVAGERRTVETLIPKGGEVTLALNDIRIDKNFSIFVPGCDIYAKTCKLDTGLCG